MTVSARKIAAFAKIVAGLADVPNLASSTLLKQWFDSSPEELRVAVNGLIDDLISTAAGASGTEQIGSAVISGVTGLTAYAQLVDLKAQLNGVVLGQIPPDLLTNGLNTQSIINGNFDIWQDVTTTSGFAFTYVADQWFCDYPNAVISQQSNGVPLASKFCARGTNTTGTGQCGIFAQALPSDTCKKLAGRKVTASIKVRKNALMSGGLNIAVEKNATGDTLLGGTWTVIGASSISNVNIPSGTTSSNWVVISVTVDIPNDGTANGIRFRVYGDAINQPNGAYFEVAQAQLGLGSTVQAFQPKSFADELIACQYFYEKSYTYSDVRGTNTYTGMVTTKAQTNVEAWSGLVFSTPKRIPPTITLFGKDGAANKVTTFGGANVGTTVSAGSIGTHGFLSTLDSATGFTAGTTYLFHYTADSRL